MKLTRVSESPCVKVGHLILLAVQCLSFCCSLCILTLIPPQCFRKFCTVLLSTMTFNVYVFTERFNVSGASFDHYLKQNKTKNLETLMETSPTNYRIFFSQSHSNLNSISVTSTGICGGTFVQPQGTITSPNYPASYPSNQVCQWVIEVPINHYVTLSFEHLQLEDCRDKIIIRDYNSTGSLQLLFFTPCSPFTAVSTL